MHFLHTVASKTVHTPAHSLRCAFRAGFQGPEFPPSNLGSKRPFCPSKNPLKGPRPTPTPPTPTDSPLHARAEAVGSGWVSCGLDTFKGLFSERLRASHRWVAVAGCQAAWPAHRARRLCVAAKPLAGSSLRATRDLERGEAALEVAKAPQGAPRGGGSPARPSPRGGRFAQAFGGEWGGGGWGDCCLCLGGAQHLPPLPAGARPLLAHHRLPTRGAPPHPPRPRAGRGPSHSIHESSGSMDFHGFSWISTNSHGIHGCPWVCMGFHRLPCISMNTLGVHGFSGKSMNFHGSPMVLMGFHGLPWISTDFHAFPSLPMGFHRFP